MKQYIGHLWLSLLVIFFSFPSVAANTPPPPWSEVIRSSTGKYVLVLISPKVKEQEDYILQSREFWRKGGIAAEDVPEAEKALQKEIDKEAAIRKKYSESGLYTAGKSPKLLWKIDLYDMKSWVKVSDDGEHIIVGKWAIPGIIEEEPLEYNPEIKKVVRAYPNMEEIILTFYSFGKPRRSYKAFELTSAEENLQRNATNDFMWSDEAVLNEKDKNLSFSITNGEKLVFDMKGNLLSGRLPDRQNSSSTSEVQNVQPSESENTKSFCGGTALLVGLILRLFLGR